MLWIPGIGYDEPFKLNFESMDVSPESFYDEKRNADGLYVTHPEWKNNRLAEGIYYKGDWIVSGTGTSREDPNPYVAVAQYLLLTL